MDGVHLVSVEHKAEGIDGTLYLHGHLAQELRYHSLESGLKFAFYLPACLICL